MDTTNSYVSISRSPPQASWDQSYSIQHSPHFLSHPWYGASINSFRARKIPLFLCISSLPWLSWFGRLVLGPYLFSELETIRSFCFFLLSTASSFFYNLTDCLFITFPTTTKMQFSNDSLGELCDLTSPPTIPSAVKAKLVLLFEPGIRTLVLIENAKEKKGFFIRAQNPLFARGSGGGVSELHFEPRKEFLVHPPPAGPAPPCVDWLQEEESASVGVDGAEPPRPRSSPPPSSLTVDIPRGEFTSESAPSPALDALRWSLFFNLIFPALDHHRHTSERHRGPIERGRSICKLKKWSAKVRSEEGTIEPHRDATNTRVGRKETKKRPSEQVGESTSHHASAGKGSSQEQIQQTTNPCKSTKRRFIVNSLVIFLKSCNQITACADSGDPNKSWLKPGNSPAPRTKKRHNSSF